MAHPPLMHLSVKTNSLPLKNCFINRNDLQNCVKKFLSKLVLKYSGFCPKTQTWTMRFGSNLASMESKCVSNNVWRDFWLPVLVLATNLEEFRWQIYCKNWFLKQAFYVTITDWNIASLKSLNTLFDKINIWTTCWQNLNEIVWYEIFKIFELFAENS